VDLPDNALSILMTLSGAAGLVLALSVMRELRAPRARRALAILFGTFIGGYLLFALHLAAAPASTTTLVVSSLLAAGGVFVTIAAKRGDLTPIQHSADWRLAVAHQHNDHLTGLPSRSVLTGYLDREIRIAARGRCIAVLTMDLDRFKEINDTLGHEVGDLAIRQVASRLSSEVNRGMLARLGGDEFAVALPGLTLAMSTTVAMRIIKRLQDPVTVAGLRLPVAISIGIAMFPGDGSDAEDLLRRAEIAMYAAKRGHLGVAVYEASLDQHTVRRLQMSAALRDAIANSEILVYYQPKLDMAKGEICAVEALARWEHPEHGMVSPEEFIPLAEQSGLITPLTMAVMREALEQVRRWRGNGVEIDVAINVAAPSIADPDFSRRVKSLLHETGVPAGSVILEITESCLMPPSDTPLRTIRTLADAGIQFAIDDFGTGYSSFDNLRGTPGGTIKIDRSFVIGMASDEGNAMLVRSIIHLAHSLGRKVVAEGVEDHASLELLGTYGCNYAQGFHICRPVPALEFANWYRNRSWGRVPNALAAPC